MPQVGTRKESPVQALADAKALIVGAQFSMSIAQLAGGSTFVPKGLHRFYTHEEAALKSQAWLGDGIARIALERKRAANTC